MLSLSLEAFNRRSDELLKGKPRATLIQRFDGSTLLIGPKSERVEFSLRATLQELTLKLRNTAGRL